MLTSKAKAPDDLFAAIRHYAAMAALARAVSAGQITPCCGHSARDPRTGQALHAPDCVLLLELV